MARTPGWIDHEGGEIQSLRTFLVMALHLEDCNRPIFIEREPLLALASDLSHPHLPSAETLAAYPWWVLAGNSLVGSE